MHRYLCENILILHSDLQMKAMLQKLTSNILNLLLKVFEITPQKKNNKNILFQN